MTDSPTISVSADRRLGRAGPLSDRRGRGSLGETCTAVAGRGAYRNGRPVEAAASVTDTAGNPRHPGADSFLAAAPGLHEAILGGLRQ